MAKKIKEEMKDVAKELGDVGEAVEEMVTETVREIKAEVVEKYEAVEDAVEEVVESVSKFATGVKVEVVGFYVRALNGIKGIVVGKDENDHTLIELDNGAKASFNDENLEQVK